MERKSASSIVILSLSKDLLKYLVKRLDNLFQLNRELNVINIYGITNVV
jgi:hypothetical protein